jgi:hypothetical protein
MPGRRKEQLTLRAHGDHRPRRFFPFWGWSGIFWDGGWGWRAVSLSSCAFVVVCPARPALLLCDECCLLCSLPDIYWDDAHPTGEYLNTRYFHYEHLRSELIYFFVLIVADRSYLHRVLRIFFEKEYVH